MLSEQAKEARRAYKRKWAHENKDKVTAQQERYWAKRAAEQAANAEQAQQEPAPEQETA